MQFNILGPLEVVRDGERLELESFKRKSMLALLLINAPEAVSSDRLIDELWGTDASMDRQNALWVQISKLRSALEPDRKKRTDGTVVLTREPGYVVDLENHRLDVQSFEQAVRKARALLDSDPARAAVGLDEALALWRGSPLEDFVFESWAQTEIVRLEEMRLGAVEDRIEADLRRGLGIDLIGDLQSLVLQHPLRERFAAQLMLALHRSGRQAEALQVYQTLNSDLGELGLEPSNAVRQLEDRILSSDPTLLAAGEGVPGRPEPGLSIRGYQVLDRIGEGTIGVAYRAVQPAVGRVVVVKVIRPELADDPEFIRRFEAEAGAVSRLEHPHIVPLFDYWREPRSAYLVMPLLQGGSLEEAVASGPLSLEQTARLVDQISTALGSAHRQGILHGNITPSNVLLDADGNAYLADFGIVAPGIGRAPSPKQPTTESSFIAPEQLTGSEPTVLSDLYALGKVVGFALTGRYPDETGDWLGHLEPALGKVITQATSIDPAARFSDAATFAVAFAEALGADVGTRRTAEPVENPYKGLRAFEEADADDFFGRDDLVERLLDRLGEPGGGGRFVAVVGPSGTGKSSLVRAGLIPALRNGALPGSGSWFIAEMTPGAHPFEQLERSLLRIAVRPPPGLLEQLTAGPDGLRRAIREVLPDDDSQLLLVVDQFEELFVLTENPIQQTFLTCLSNAVADPASRLRLLITLRADFYDRPLRNREFGELLRHGTEAITPMSPEELERAIAGPAEHVGVQYEPAALAEITAEVANQPNALPLLQHALTELFEQRRNRTVDLAAYRSVGGVAGALVRRADSLLDGLSDEARTTARQVFLRLVAVDEGAVGTRRRVPLDQLVSMPPGAVAVREVVQTFGRHRLLTFDRHPVTREPTVELAHEALLQEWPTLRTWVEERLEDLLVYRRFRNAVNEWVGSDCDPSYLLTGGRLAHFEAWHASTDLTLSDGEQRFLRASRDQTDMLARRRRSRRLLITSGFAAAAVIGLVLAVAAFVSMRRANEEAETRRELAAISRARELAVLAITTIDDDPELGLLLALQSLAATDVPERQSVEVLHQAVAASRALWRFSAEEAVIEPVFHHIGHDTFAVADTDGRIHLFDTADAQPLGVLPAIGDGEWQFVYVSPVTGYVAAVPVQDGGAVRVWDPAAKRIKWSTEGVVPPQHDAWFSPDGRWLATVQHFAIPGRVSLWDAETGDHLWTVAAEADWIAFDPAGDRIAFLALRQRQQEAFGRSDLTIVDRASGTELVERTHLGAWMVEFSANGDAIYAGNHDGTLETLDADSLDTLGSFEAHEAQISAIAVSSEGGLLATGSADEVKLWDASSHRLEATLRGHSEEVVVLAFSEEGDRLYSFSMDVTVRAWNASATGPGEGFVAGTTGEIRDVSISPDGRTLVAHTLRERDSAPAEARVVIWDVETGDLVPPPAASGGGAGLNGIAFSPDGETHAVRAGSEPGGVHLLDTATGAVPVAFDPAVARVLRFSPDGSRLAIGGAGDIAPRSKSSVSLFDADTGEPVQRMTHYAEAVADMAFSAQGSHLGVVTCGPGRLVVWDWEVNARVFFEQASDCLSGVAFSPVAPLVIAVGYDVVPTVWNIETGEEHYRLEGRGPANAVAFSPDGRLLATAAPDGAVRIWDASDGTELLTISVTAAGLGAVEFLPDGQHIAVGTLDGFVRVYTLDVDELEAIAASRVTRSFTAAECTRFNLDPCPTR